MYKLWDELNAAKKLRWIELSHPLDNSSPFWSGIPEGSVELCKTVFDWGNPMLECLIQTFKFPGQFGTHIDVPGHFAHEGALSEAFGVRDFVFPLCVIDITEQVAKDCHYAVTVDDVKAWEAAYGPIPDGAFVALRTDWSKREVEVQIHIRASLASMGGNPTPEDLIRAAEIIREGALLVQELEAMNLSYTETF